VHQFVQRARRRKSSGCVRRARWKSSGMRRTRVRLCRCSWVRVRPWRLKFPLEWVRPCVHGGWVRPAEGACIHGHKARLGITDYLLDWGLGGSVFVRGLHVQPGREERRKTSHAVTEFGGTPWSAELSSGDWRWRLCLLCGCAWARGEGDGRLQVEEQWPTTIGLWTCGGLGCLLNHGPPMSCEFRI
jgi:hypothetical protein